MKRVWVLISLLVALSIVLAWAVSCRKDIYVEPPPSIVGTYKGTYCYREGNNLIDTCQGVKVTFKADTWIMYIDTNRTKEAQRMACDCDGDYTLENGVQLDTTHGNLTKSVCTESWLPVGSFQMIRNQNDTTCPLLLQQVADDAARGIRIYKTLCLKPAIF